MKPRRVQAVAMTIQYRVRGMILAVQRNDETVVMDEAHASRGKENGLQILQSIDQGPFELGTTRDALGTTPEGGVLLRPERPRTYEDLSDTKKRTMQMSGPSNIVLQDTQKISTSSSITTLKQKQFGTTS
ncbi:hypothetical protein Tco_0117908 [Tanacetum coccineum]